MSTSTSAAYSVNCPGFPDSSDHFRKAATALLALRSFLPNRQFVSLFVAASPFTGDSPELVQAQVLELHQRIEALQSPAPCDGEAAETAHLHYATKDTHWYITNRDTGVGPLHAQGYTIRRGLLQSSRPQYISIDAITICGAELDLEFKACSAPELLARYGHLDAAGRAALRPWVLVDNAGHENQHITDDFGSFQEAVATMDMAGHGDILQRLADDRLVKIY